MQCVIFFGLIFLVFWFKKQINSAFIFIRIELINYQSCRIHDTFAHVQLSDIRVIATLGVGGFGRVELVQIGNDTTRSYGLKQMKKSQVSITSNLFL